MVAILSLAIAIALNTTMYGVLEGLLRPRVAVRNGERVYELRFFGDRRKLLAPDAVEQALRTGLRTFEGVTGLIRYSRIDQPIAEAGNRFRRVKAAVVRTNFFDVLGTPPLQGRTLFSADHAGEAAIISHRLAETLFQGEPAVGQPIVLDGKHHTVVGVVEGTPSYMPLSFDVWVPTGSETRLVPVSLIRLREQASVPAMKAELKVIASRLAIAAGELPSDVAFRFKPLRIVVGLRWIHRGLIAAVAAILLVACANLANLQLARDCRAVGSSRCVPRLAPLADNSSGTSLQRVPSWPVSDWPSGSCSPSGVCNPSWRSCRLRWMDT